MVLKKYRQIPDDLGTNCAHQAARIAQRHFLLNAGQLRGHILITPHFQTLPRDDAEAKDVPSTPAAGTTGSGRHVPRDDAEAAGAT